MRPLLTTLACLLLIAPLAAQKHRREPLTEKQQDEIAEAGINPVARVNLYVRFINDYSDAIKGLTPRAKTSARVFRMDDALQDFAALMDELSDNLDVYSERKADLRKSLKGLNDSIAQWQQVLKSIPSESGFEVSLKDAIATANDLAGQAKQITTDQEAYFAAHPKEKGQDRWEPQ